MITVVPTCSESRHRHAQVVAQNFLEILIVHPAGDHRRDAQLDGFPHGVAGHSGPADDDMVFHVRRKQLGGEFFLGVGTGHFDFAVGFAADAEDALDVGDLGFDDHAFVGDHLDDFPRQKREHLDGERLAANDELPRDFGHRFQRARCLGFIFVLEHSEDALGAGERLADFDGFAFLDQETFADFRRRQREQVREIDRRDIARHKRLGDDILRSDLLAHLDEHITRNRQQPPSLMANAVGDF